MPPVKRIDNLKMVGKEPTFLTILLFLDFLVFIFQKPTYYFTGYSKFSSISYDEVDEIKKHQLSTLDKLTKEELRTLAALKK